MIDYEIYKILHLFMIVILFSSFAVQCFAEKKHKVHSILAGVSSLLILVSGMGLLARLGISHTSGWPMWAVLKVFFWAFIAFLTPVVVKRFPQHKQKWFWFILADFIIIAAIIIYKPA